MAVDTKNTYIQLDTGAAPKLSGEQLVELINKAPQKQKKLVKRVVSVARNMAQPAESEAALKRKMAIAGIEDAAEEMAVSVIGQYLESILVTMCGMAIGFTVCPETGRWIRVKPSMRACEYLLDRILGKRQAKDAAAFTSKVLVTVSVPENGTEPRKVQGVVIDE